MSSDRTPLGRCRASWGWLRISPAACTLRGGGSVAAIVTHGNCMELGLAVGGTAAAIFRASCVIVGAPA
ncbi:hypothetical protein [Acidovorax sp. JHL-9]|uniref:hypothetical protein n=1 Tax=Acidovorax sp. JHL-9 TaxID=1276756 RepID=UPI0012DEBA42|nr:hypothetical protein [Acidovorax sp. JHL-9]